MCKTDTGRHGRGGWFEKGLVDKEMDVDTDK